MRLIAKPSRIQPPSPSLALFSPPLFDNGDASSDDGDSLYTPLTEHHDRPLHPCDVYEPHHFSQHLYHPYPAKSKLDLSGPAYSPASERTHDDLFPASLDLANASLQIARFDSPTYPTRALDPGASPFTPTRHNFEIGSPVFAPSPLLRSEASPSADELSSLPSLTLSNIGCASDDSPSLLLSPEEDGSSLPSPGACEEALLLEARFYSPRFSASHLLNPSFARTYQLGDELGAGGYGFVMTAQDRGTGQEVAVKFIIKDKVPEHAWWEDDVFGRIPTEVMLLSLVNHENIVRCLDVFEDDVYFYLVQELHGTPWVAKKHKKGSIKQLSAPGKLDVPSPSSTPLLTPSQSVESRLDDSAPQTPRDSPCPSTNFLPQYSGAVCGSEQYLKVPPTFDPRPSFGRRASHDLFECIEQSKHKRLSENQARYVFAQVVEAVYYLDTQGITHCDIKDENLVIDADLKVKLIDFGSAVVSDPSAPRPYYTLFFGTTAYASSEILLKKPYQAPPAEIWTLGVLLSYLLTGHSPFPSEQDAKDGRVVIREPKSGRLSRSAIALMARCLERDPARRADIHEVRGHRWLAGAMECGGRD